jgi:hypothetical protein
MVICAETGDALRHGGAGNAAKEEEVEDAGVERHAVVGGSIAQVDGDFDGFSGLQHLVFLDEIRILVHFSRSCEAFRRG